MIRELQDQSSQSSTGIRVLHLFAPTFRHRFGGQNLYWKFSFSHWNHPNVAHLVLDYEQNVVASAKDAFDFEYSGPQTTASRWERAFWIFTLFRNLYKHKGQFDVLHVHVLWWGGLLVGPWAKGQKIPAVYESVLLGEDTPSGIRRERFGRLKGRCLKEFSAILPISEGLAADYRRSGFDRDRVVTLMNCLDVELFAPPRSAEEKQALRRVLDLPQDATILLFVGSVIERKGADLLVRAFVEAAHQSNLYLLVVGPHTRKENPSLDEQFVNDLQLLIHKHNLSGQVRFTGLVQDRQTLAELYQVSDIFVFPSRNEGFPNVLLEAMCSGSPAIVSELPGVDMVVKHGENGWLVPVGDAGSLRDAILLLEQDRPLAAKMGARARLRVSHDHGFPRWQSRLASFYHELLKAC